MQQAWDIADVVAWCVVLGWRLSWAGRWVCAGNLGYAGPPGGNWHTVKLLVQLAQGDFLQCNLCFLSSPSCCCDYSNVLCPPWDTDFFLPSHCHTRGLTQSLADHCCVNSIRGFSLNCWRRHFFPTLSSLPALTFRLHFYKLCLRSITATIKLNKARLFTGDM